MNSIGTKELYTKRLKLRRFHENDAEELFRGYINQEEFLYYTNKRKRTLEEEKQILAGIGEKYKNNDYYNWLITLKENNKIIGSINLSLNNKNDSVEFNYAIDNRYINNGYMTEALEIIKEFCFNEIKVNRFQGGCCVQNLASKRVMEKCNMKCEGILEKYIKLQDGYHDMYMFSIAKQ